MTSETAPKPSRRELFKGSAVSAATLSALALSACGEKETKPTPQIEQPAEPTTDPTTAEKQTPDDNFGLDPRLEGEELRNAVEIDAGLDREQYGKAFADRISAWRNHGLVQATEASDAMTNSDGGWDQEKLNDAYADIASANAEAFAAAIFGDGWSSSDSPEIPRFVETMINANTMCMYLAVATSDKEFDEAQFKSWEEFHGIAEVLDTELGEGEDRFAIEMLATSNADKNRAEELAASTSFTTEDQKRTYVVTTQETGDGNTIISYLHINDDWDL